MFVAGIWGVGLATRNTNLNSAPGGNDPESWVFCYDGVLRHNKKELQGVTKRATEGDVIVRLVEYWVSELKRLENTFLRGYFILQNKYGFVYFSVFTGYLIRSYRIKLLH